MALGLQDVLSKKRNNSQAFAIEKVDLAHVEMNKENLRPWEQSAAAHSTKQAFQDNAMDRAERAVLKARNIVASNTKMIEEIHARRQVESLLTILPSSQVQKPVETFTEMEIQDPVLKMGKKGLWETLSEILN